MPQNDSVTVRTLQQRKEHGQRITMLTAYDYPTARWLDDAGVDVVLVGDSLAMVVQGKDTTLPVTVGDMIYHGRMVTRAVRRAMVLVDLPFPVGQLGVRHTVKVAARIIKQTGCQGVKLEGGSEQADVIRSLVSAGIPTMAHVGLRPQSVHALGGYRVQRSREILVRDAQAAQSAGAFAVLMECVPENLAAEITSQLSVPTIGIGAGARCDGQVLVTHDLLGIHEEPGPKFVRAYAQFRDLAIEAIQRFREDVQAGTFPGEAESFH
jgi:3-methyl-2-oxobutanoate hydroxymethyltransferase